MILLSFTSQILILLCGAGPACTTQRCTMTPMHSVRNASFETESLTRLFRTLSLSSSALGEGSPGRGCANACGVKLVHIISGYVRGGTSHWRHYSSTSPLSCMHSISRPPSMQMVDQSPLNTPRRLGSFRPCLSLLESLLIFVDAFAVIRKTADVTSSLARRRLQC